MAGHILTSLGMESSPPTRTSNVLHIRRRLPGQMLSLGVGFFYYPPDPFRRPVSSSGGARFRCRGSACRLLPADRSRHRSSGVAHSMTGGIITQSFGHLMIGAVTGEPPTSHGSADNGSEEENADAGRPSTVASGTTLGLGKPFTID